MYEKKNISLLENKSKMQMWLYISNLSHCIFININYNLSVKKLSMLFDS